jgi:hypothetical protein
LTEAPVLVSPDYSKDFLIFSFSSFDTVAVVLLQKNVEGLEQPISFFSRALRDAEVRYDIMEKQAYALVKSLKDFRAYVLHSKVIAYVPSVSVKDILLQPNIDVLKQNSNFYFKNKIFNILESLPFLNLCKTKFSYLMNSEIHLGFISGKRWLKINQ